MQNIYHRTKDIYYIRENEWGHKKHACFLLPNLPYFFPKKCHSLHTVWSFWTKHH